MKKNAMMLLTPYKSGQTWVFDDEATGLVREPFVAGIPQMIDVLTVNIPNAAEGFRLIFSAKPFPNFDAHLKWVRSEHGGNWYKLEQVKQYIVLAAMLAKVPFKPKMEGWLCPNLFKYFEKAPKNIYMKGEMLIHVK
jgi:hypothetical protein